MKTLLWAGALALLPFAGPARADHYMQTADPQVLQALNDLIGVYGMYCQQGDPTACQLMQSVQMQGGQMLNAGYDCQMMGNQQACFFYQQSNGQLSQAHAGLMGAMGQQQIGAMPGYDPNGHAQRMQDIHTWGQERLDWGAQQSQIMDQNHQQFLETLRQ